MTQEAFKAFTIILLFPSVLLAVLFVFQTLSFHSIIRILSSSHAQHPQHPHHPSSVQPQNASTTEEQGVVITVGGPTSDAHAQRASVRSHPATLATSATSATSDSDLQDGYAADSDATQAAATPERRARQQIIDELVGLEIAQQLASGPRGSDAAKATEAFNNLP